MFFHYSRFFQLVQGQAVRFLSHPCRGCAGFFAGALPLRPRWGGVLWGRCPHAPAKGSSTLWNPFAANASAFAWGESACPVRVAMHVLLHLQSWRAFFIRALLLPLVLAALSAPFGVPVTCQKPEPPPPSLCHRQRSASVPAKGSSTLWNPIAANACAFA